MALNRCMAWQCKGKERRSVRLWSPNCRTNRSPLALPPYCKYSPWFFAAKYFYHREFQTTSSNYPMLLTEDQPYSSIQRCVPWHKPTGYYTYSTKSPWMTFCSSWVLALWMWKWNTLLWVAPFRPSLDISVVIISNGRCVLDSCIIC